MFVRMMICQLAFLPKYLISQGGHTISIKKFQDFSRIFQGKSLFFQG